MVRAFFAFIVLSIIGVIALPARAADAPDLSTPKKAAIAFAKGVESGDMTVVKATAIGTDSQYKLVEAIIGLIGANKELRTAAVDKFGEEGKQITNDDLSNLSKQLEQADETINDDSGDRRQDQRGRPDETEKDRRQLEGGLGLDSREGADDQVHAKGDGIRRRRNQGGQIQDN